MRRTNKIKRQGFTLVELLIVIVVIGILSAMMMLSSTEATTSARASNIMSNLRNLKTAALAFYADNLDHFNTTLNPSTDPKFVLGRIIPYMKAGAEATNDNTATDEFAGYTCVALEKHWYVGYTSASEKRIQEKIQGRAKAVQLLQDANGNNTEYSSGVNVYMLVLDMSGTSTTTPTNP